MSTDELEIIGAEARATHVAAIDHEKRQIGWFIMLTALSAFTIGMLNAATPLFAVALAAGPGESARIAATIAVGGVLLALAARYFGIRILFIAGGALGGVICFAAPYTGAPLWMLTALLWLLAATAAISVYIPAGFAYRNPATAHDVATASPGLGGWRSLQLLGAVVIGPVLGSYLVVALSPLGTYWVIGFVLFLAAWSARRTWQAEAATPFSGPRTRTGGAVAAQGGELVTGIILLFFVVYIPLIAVEQFHYSTIAVTGLLAAQGLSYSSALLLLRGLVGRLGKDWTRQVSFGSGALGLFLLGTAQSADNLMVGAVLLGFGLGLVGIIHTTAPAPHSVRVRLDIPPAAHDAAPPADLSALLGGLIGALGGGALGYYIGLQQVFLVLMVGVLLMMLVGLPMRFWLYLRVIVDLMAVRTGRLATKLFRIGALALTPAALLGLWFLAAARGWVSPQVLPSPTVVWNTLWELIGNGEIPRNLGISLTRVLEGFVLGSAIGLALGFAMGISRCAEQYIGPIFKALSSVPMLGWLPVVIVLAGIDETFKVVMITIGCITPVAINTYEGVRNIPRGYVEVARVFQFDAYQLLREVIIPAAAPSIFTGISLALSHAWKALVAVELIASSEGIGFVMVMGRQLFQLDIVLATIVVIGLVGLVLDQVLRYAEAHLLRWRRAAI